MTENNRTGESRQVSVRALFVFIGAQPFTQWLTGPGGAQGRRLHRDGRDGALHPETSLPGVLAAGDVRRGWIMRVASAVGEDAMAVKLVRAHLRRSHGSLIA